MIALLAEDAPASTENPILPEPSEMFWAAICFTLLYLLIRYVFLPPVLEVMDGREKKVSDDLQAAASAKHKVANASFELEEQLSDVKAEADAIIEQARSEAAAERSRLVSQAEREVAVGKQAVQEEIDAQRLAALSSLQPKMANIAASAASKVLDTNVADATAQASLNQLMESSK